MLPNNSLERTPHQLDVQKEPAHKEVGFFVVR